MNRNTEKPMLGRPIPLFEVTMVTKVKKKIVGIIDMQI